jgi:hypothetical protein
MGRQKGTDLDGARTNTRTEKFKISDKITVMKFPEKKWVTGRLWGVLHSYAIAWVKGKTKEGKPTKFPVYLPSYDPETQQFDSTVYDPWYKIWEEEKGIERDDQTVQINRKFYGNFLLRAAQRQKPSKVGKPTADERSSGFKEKDSDTWTPWQPVALPPGLVQKIQELKGLNVVESKKTGSSKAFSVTHEKFGRDIQIYYDSTKAPGDQYQVQLSDRKPLTEEELAFLRWDTSELAPEPLTEEQVRKDYEDWCKRMGRKVKKARKIDPDEDVDVSDDDDDQDDDDTPKSKGKKKPAPKSKRRADSDEDDSDSDDDDLDDDDDDDEPVSKSKSKSKKRPDPDEDDDEDDDSSDDDEDEDDDTDDDEDEDGDDDSDSDDDDEDDDDDLDDDDEPASKSKAKSKKPARSKKPSNDDDDADEEDEDDDDDLDDDDEPVSKSKAKSKAKPAAKKPVAKSKKRPDPDEDDDEDDSDSDDDDDLDDDDDDTPPPPKSKKPATKKPAAKTTKKRK